MHEKRNGISSNCETVAYRKGEMISPWVNGGMKPMLKLNPTGVSCPQLGFRPPLPPENPRFFGRPTRQFIPRHRHGRGKFTRQFNKNFAAKNDNTRVPEFDLTKPWVTDEIRNEEIKKQEIFEIWKKTKTDEIWSRFETQKLAVLTLYDKAKAEYAAAHPNEVILQDNSSTPWQYFCEACDKSFRSEKSLILHEGEHETCGRDGCEFTAHPKIISKHIKMQHLSGLYQRIGKLHTNEDIAKWIEERKKRYPTRKVIEEKKILEQEKLDRGERVKGTECKFNKSFINRKRGNGKKNLERKTSKNTKSRQIKKKKKVSVGQKCLEEISDVRKGVPAFLGIRTDNVSVTNEAMDLNISDEEWEIPSKPLNDTNPLLNSSLGLLAQFYNSDEECQKQVSHKNLNEANLSADEGSEPDEVSSKNPLPEELKENKTSCKRKCTGKTENQSKRRNTYNDNTVEKHSLTLLEKLLKNEIRHERNVILQCVHYVVKNNFFKL